MNEYNDPFSTLWKQSHKVQIDNPIPLETYKITTPYIEAGGVFICRKCSKTCKIKSTMLKHISEH